MRGELDELRLRLAEIADVRAAEELLDWDQQVCMPRAAAQARADQLATLERIAHERFTSPAIGRLLDALAPYEADGDPEDDDVALVRVTRRDWEKAIRVPADLRARMMHAAASGFERWAVARSRSRFADFRPSVERNLELRHEYIDCFDGHRDPYDVLLDDFEEGMTTAEAADVLEELRAALVDIVDAAKAAGEPEASFLRGPFPVPAQRRVERALLARLGFDDVAWRVDEILHPAQFSFSTTDVRIATRYAEDSLESLFSVLHEFGHGLYERQIDPALERTPLRMGVSMALHESQSRLWENLVGRSRPFWEGRFPEVRRAFPEALAGVKVEAFYRAINRVEPSLIRVDADEVTYSLHIVLRFELERRLVSGTLDARDLPDAWNDAVDRYLGLEVPDDAHGVLQDAHWSGGAFGYFPTYALGNLVAAQLWQRLSADLGGVDDAVARGDFGPLREWLREQLHRHGRKFTPRETLERAVGAGLDAAPYLAYLRHKVADVYGVGTRG